MTVVTFLTESRIWRDGFYKAGKLWILSLLDAGSAFIEINE